MWHRADSGRGRGRKEEWRVKRRECKSISIEFNRIECLAFCWQLWVMQLNSIANSLLDTASTRRPLTHSLSGPSSSEWPVSTQPPTRRTLAFKSSELLFIAHSHARSITPNRIQNRKWRLVKGKGRQLSAQEGQLGATLSAVFNYLVGCLICWHFWFGQTDRQTDAHGHSHSQFGLV